MQAQISALFGKTKFELCLERGSDTNKMPPRKGGSRQHAKASGSTQERKDEPTAGDKRSLSGARSHSKKVSQKAESLLLSEQTNEIAQNSAAYGKIDVPAPGTEEHELAQKEYYEHLLGLWARNQVSGKNAQADALKSTRAGAKGVEPIAVTGTVGRNPKNINRDLVRGALRGNTMPPEYVAEVLTHDPATGRNKVPMMIPFLLMHEMLFWLICTAKRITVDVVISSLSGAAARLHANICSRHNFDVKTLIPIGFHGDGVAFIKNKTVEVFSWNCIGLPSAERVFFCCLEKRFFCQCGCHGRCTLNSILEIFKYSLLSLWEGTLPSARHDLRAWLNSDKNRQQISETKFGFFGVLMQIRGDWSFYKTLFGFKGWASKTSICWLCRANRENMKDFSPSAIWRKQRHTTASILKILKESGVALCVLFTVPAFTISMIMIDLLHTLDLGVSQDILGNLFHEALGTNVLEGRSKKDSCVSLLNKIKKHYREVNAPTRISNLSVEMIKVCGKKPKLRTKGAETRHLVPFGVRLAEEMHTDDPSPKNLIILKMMRHLLTFYMSMNNDKFDADTCGKAARQCCLAYAALSEAAVEKWAWHVKPKWHLFIELAEFQAHESGNPKHFWAYKDEDFVGFIAEIAQSRGGQRNADTVPFQVIRRYKMLSD